MRNYVKFYAVVFDVKHPKPAEIGKAAIRAIGEATINKAGVNLKGELFIFNADKSVAYKVGVRGAKYGQLDCYAVLVKGAKAQVVLTMPNNEDFSMRVSVFMISVNGDVQRSLNLAESALKNYYTTRVIAQNQVYNKFAVLFNDLLPVSDATIEDDDNINEGDNYYEIR